MGAGKEPLLILVILCMTGKCLSNCPRGQNFQGGTCEDVNECNENPNVCGNYTVCVNTIGSYQCHCLDGYRNVLGENTFTGLDGQCKDNNECIDRHYVNVCGHGHCTNLIGSYKCTCQFGYTNNMDSRGPCKEDKNECDEAKEKNEDLCGVNGTCENTDGSYYCKCQTGFTNYGNERTSCTKLECDSFDADVGPAPSFEGLEEIRFLMRNSCLALSTHSVAGELDGEALLERLFTATDTILASGHLDSRGDMSRLLGTVEDAIMLIGPQLKDNHTKLETTKTDAKIIVQRGKTRPTGPLHLTNGNDTLITDWTTAAGTGPYPGFAMAALLSYKNIDTSVNHSFEWRTKYRKDGVDPTFQVSSVIVSVVVSNPSTQNLSRPVNIIFRHLQDTNTSQDVEYICVYWSKNLTWSQGGCYRNQSSTTHTHCTCNHLSSFAVLMAVYPVKNSLALQVLTKIGLIISLLCLVLCILTFKFCRSIQGTRTTIHLHLCICLFLADLFFLTGISQTKPVGGCRFVAAMLHFFFLGVFSWMLLEGVQLYRMVVLVFNATIRPLYLFVFGYGTPLLIVVVSAIVRPSGYGTDQHCWLSLEDGLLWSFFGPVCLIIILNVFFFIITVWRLAQKFSSLNPDLSKLDKIKAFTVTAIAQMCILGLMWVFGAFLFQEGSTALEYIFTILNSLQGALIFVMHCLLSKQVRDEYAHFFSCIICTPQKKKYSEMSSTNPSSSQSQASRSLQNTGESQI